VKDPARTEDPPAPEVETALMEAAMHAPCMEEGEELRTAHQLPLASLSFAEMHMALGDFHVVSVVLMWYGLPPLPEGQLGLEGRVDSLMIGPGRLTFLFVVCLCRPR
jgi:hypothetical protein